MAGRGQRFKNQNYPQVKPLIHYKNKPLFIWAINSISHLLDNSNLHLVICEEDNIESQVLSEISKDNKLKNRKINIIKIESRTTGPALTAFEALKSLNENSETVIFCDCDLYFKSHNWIKFIEKWDPEIGATTLYFNADSLNFSYIKINEMGLVEEVAEKKQISNHAIAGFYAFKNKQLFINSVEAIKEKKSHQEFYISYVYEDLIQKNEKIKSFKVDEIILMGTPEELNLANKE